MTPEHHSGRSDVPTAARGRPCGQCNLGSHSLQSPPFTRRWPSFQPELKDPDRDQPRFIGPSLLRLLKLKDNTKKYKADIVPVNAAFPFE